MRHRLLVLVAAAVTAAVVVPLPSAAAADSDSARVAQKKGDRKKKKKKVQPTAIVNGTFTIRWDAEGGFGGDHGPNFQELTVTVDDAKIPVAPGTNTIGTGKAKVKWVYHAEAHTTDRSWAVGCDSEDHQSDGTWSGTVPVSVSPARWLVTNGKQKKYLGWEVQIGKPDYDAFKLTSSTSYQTWDSLLEDTCTTTTNTDPLGMWNKAFADVIPAGKLASDDKSVKLTAINTYPQQTGTVSGSIKFSHPMS